MTQQTIQAVAEPGHMVAPRGAASSAYAPGTDEPAADRRAGACHAVGRLGDVFGVLIESASVVTLTDAALR